MSPSRVSRRLSVFHLQSILTTSWTVLNKKSRWLSLKSRTYQILQVDQSLRTIKQVLTDLRFPIQVSALHTDLHLRANQLHHRLGKDLLQLPNTELPAWLTQASWVVRMFKAEFTIQDTTWRQANREALPTNIKVHIKPADWTVMSQPLTNQAPVHCNRDHTRHQPHHTKQYWVEVQAFRLEHTNQVPTRPLPHPASSHPHISHKEPINPTNLQVDCTDHRPSSLEPLNCQSHLIRNEPNE